MNWEKERYLWEEQRGIWDKDDAYPLDQVAGLLNRLPKREGLSNCDVDFTRGFAFDRSDRSLPLSRRYPVSKRLLAEKKVAVVLLAGGQSTRLGLQGSKGFFPASSVKKKSLFALFCERQAFLESYYQTSIALAVLCQDPVEVESYFARHEYFGLNPEQIDFFAQSELPLLTEDLKAVVKESGSSLLTGPDGNGGVFEALIRSGVWSKWQKAKIEVVATSLIDNPLMAPFALPALEQLGKEKESPCLLCAIACDDPSEKVGLLGRSSDGSLRVVEYGEHSQQKNKEVFAANSGAIMWSFKHLNRALQSAFPTLFGSSSTLEENLSAKVLPLHLARKRYKVPTERGSQEVTLIKVETFIFDWLQILQKRAEKASALVLNREQYFYPLKNKEGDYSPETFINRMSQRARTLLKELGIERINGIALTDLHIELGPWFEWLEIKELLEWVRSARGVALPRASNLSLPSADLERAGIFYRY